MPQQGRCQTDVEIMLKSSFSSNEHIGFDAAGHGKPLVFLHAFPLNRAMWAEQVDEFSSDYYVIAMDARGMGESVAFDAAPAMETIARDLEQLLRYLKIEQPIALCGLSMGGYAAMAFAGLFPEKLCALILADTRPDADSEEARANRATMIEVAKEQGSSAVAEKMMPKLLGDTTRAEKPEVVGLVQNLAAQQKGEGLAQALEALRDRPDSTELLQSLNVPTLVITGEEDSITSPEIMGRMAQSMPRAQHVVIPKAGHLANLEQPREFNWVVREFLEGLKDSG